jgi:branched-chain amino acid transport system substrate-binding protein
MPIISADGIAGDPGIVTSLGPTSQVSAYATSPVRDVSVFDSGVAATFIRDYHANYSTQVLDGYTANAYDATMVLIRAIKQLIAANHPVSRDAVIDAVQNMQYDGLTGHINFDKNGDLAHCVYSIYTVQDGRWVYLKQVRA